MNQLIRYGFFAASIGLAVGQNNPANPAFEVASIKEVAPGFGSRMQFLPGGRFEATTWPLQLIMDAYEIKRYQVIGAPTWTGSAKFFIQAKTEDSTADNVRMRLMLQKLLADRFQLRVHRDSKEMTAYAMVVDKGGPKIQPLKDGAGGTCGIGFNFDGFFACRGLMSDLATALEGLLREPVLDQTGMDGKYDIKLDFDQFELAGRQAPPDHQQPPLMTAIREELGLKLDHQRREIPVIVVDSIERPSQN
jgi:uncharacterized protein (TIGR03435 family)